MSESRRFRVGGPRPIWTSPPGALPAGVASGGFAAGASNTFCSISGVCVSFPTSQHFRRLKWLSVAMSGSRLWCGRTRLHDWPTRSNPPRVLCADETPAPLHHNARVQARRLHHNARPHHIGEMLLHLVCYLILPARTCLDHRPDRRRPPSAQEALASPQENAAVRSSLLNRAQAAGGPPATTRIWHVRCHVARPDKAQNGSAAAGRSEQLEAAGPQGKLDAADPRRLNDGRKGSEPVVPSKNRGTAGPLLVARGHYICDVQ